MVAQVSLFIHINHKLLIIFATSATCFRLCNWIQPSSSNAKYKKKMWILGAEISLCNTMASVLFRDSI